jgi:Cu-processing system permease protein
MSIVARIAVRQAGDIVRSRWVLAYVAFFVVATESLLRFAGGDARTLLSLANVMLFVTPLITIVFGSVYLYNAREFTELLLTQPVSRSRVFAGLYLGLTATLIGAWLAGVGLPLVLRGMLVSPDTGRAVFALLATGVALTAAFSALATLISVRVDDRLKGLGLAIAVWLALALVYDGVVLIAIATLGEGPIEPVTLTLMALNPVDLARVLILLQLDAAALLGYTGALFHKVFADSGVLLAAGALLLWIVAPLAFAARAFRTKDF